MLGNESSGMVMPVSPMNNGGFGGDMGGNGWWMILLFVILFGAGGWNMGNNGAVPFAMGTGIQEGFNQAALTSGLNDIQGAICNGFSQAEIADNSRQMANMNQNFALQTAMSGGFNNLQSQLASCCCENRLASADLKYTIATENCADRAAVSDGIRDILVANNANTQRILDQMCNDKIDSKNERIAELERELTMANLKASQTAQTGRILADNAAQTVALEQYLNPVPVPAYVVANPNCCNTGNTCGCGSF